MTVCGDDRGVATVWAAGAIAVLVSMAVFGLHLGEAMVARHHAESAADLAAPAAAAEVVAGEQYACAQARRVTDRMRVQLASCQIRGLDVLVNVEARPAGLLGRLGGATAQARAGPTVRSPVNASADRAHGHGGTTHPVPVRARVPSSEAGPTVTSPLTVPDEPDVA